MRCNQAKLWRSVPGPQGYSTASELGVSTLGGGGSGDACPADAAACIRGRTHPELPHGVSARDNPGGYRVGTGPVTNAAQRSISPRRWSNRSLRA